MLTIGRQKQIIRDMVAGKEYPADLRKQLDEGFQYLVDLLEMSVNQKPPRFVKDEAGIAEWQSSQRDRALVLLAADKEWKTLVTEILSLTPGQKPVYRSAAETGENVARVSWLWYRWIVRGFISILAGDGSAGKSGLVLDIMKRLSLREPAPDGQEFDMKTGRSIFIDAEGFGSGIYQRLRGWGADLNKIYILERPNFSDRGYKDNVLDMIQDLKPDLIALDSLSSLIEGGHRKVEDVRPILRFLVDVAEQENIALLLNHHLRKPDANTSNAIRIISQHDLVGSGYIANMGRSVIAMSVLNEDGLRRLSIIKGNLTKYPIPVAVKIISHPDDPDLPVLLYDNEQVADVVTTDTHVNAAATWLLDTVGSQAMSYKDLLTAAMVVGFNKTTLLRARHKLDWQITDTLGPRVTGNLWKLQEAGYGDTF